MSGPAAHAQTANPGWVRPPFVYLAAILAGFAMQSVRPIRLRGGAAAGVVGVLLVAAGAVLFALTQREFRAAGTTVRGNRPATAVVRGGPMRLSRNPIYLAFSILQLGLGIGFQSGWVLVTLVPAVALMHFVVIPREERFMEARFGDAYTSYKASVRRWL